MPWPVSLTEEEPVLHGIVNELERALWKAHGSYFGGVDCNPDLAMPRIARSVPVQLERLGRLTHRKRQRR